MFFLVSMGSALIFGGAVLTVGTFITYSTATGDQRKWLWTLALLPLFPISEFLVAFFYRLTAPMHSPPIRAPERIGHGIIAIFVLQAFSAISALTASKGARPLIVAAIAGTVVTQLFLLLPTGIALAGATF